MEKKEVLTIGIASKELAILRAERLLRKKGKTNIKITSILPLENKRGYNISVLYDEELIDINNIRKTREKIYNLNEEFDKLQRPKEVVLEEIKTIQKECNHKIGVAIRNWGDILDEGYCLNCNHRIESVWENFKDSYFCYTIYFDNDIYDSIPRKEKIELVLNLFEQERALNSELNDEQIVEIINNKIKLGLIPVEKKVMVKKMIV